MNAAWSRGLGTVINSQGIMQSPVVREHAAAPDEPSLDVTAANLAIETFLPINPAGAARLAELRASGSVRHDNARRGARPW